MKAVLLRAYGGVEQLRLEEVERPSPGLDEVLVRVAATSINPIDFKLRSGVMKDLMPLSLPAILGRDVAGTVEKVGTDVRNPQVGQKVIGLVNRSYAEYLTARAEHLTVVPDGLDLEEAGALPLILTTGAQLIQQMRLYRGDVVLVTGALGSVARAAIYLAKSQGLRVIAGVKSLQKEDAASLGADEVVALDNDSEIASLPELNGIADTVGHGVIGKVISKLKAGGVLGSVLGPSKEAEGKSIRVEVVFAKPDASLLRQMADAVRDGKLIIPIAKTMKLSEAGEAQALAEKGSVGGKILLIP